MTRRKITLTLALASAAILTIVLAGIVFEQPIREQWYIWNLESDTPRERWRAAKALGKMRSARAVVPLLDVARRSLDELWGPEDIDAYFAKALIAIGPEAVGPLVEVLSDPAEPRDLRLHGAAILEVMEEEGVIPDNASDLRKRVQAQEWGRGGLPE